MFSLVFLGVLIFEEIQMGSVSQITSLSLDPAQKNSLGVSGKLLKFTSFFVYKFRGLKNGCKTVNFYTSIDSALISPVFIRRAVI